jgi:tetratricopeptide (TPR) repeat protein
MRKTTPPSMNQKETRYKFSLKPGKHLPSKAPKYEVEFNAAWDAIGNKNYQAALDMLHTIPFKNCDQSRWLYTQSICLRELGKCQEALGALKKVEKTEGRSKRVSLGYARCYQKTGEYEVAVSFYQKIPNLTTDRQALLGFARCLAEMGDYKEAIAKLHTIKNWGKDKQVLLSLARNHQDRGHYETALTTFHQIPEWKTDKQALLGMACCYQKSRDYKNSLHYFHQIKNWKNDKQVLLSLSHYYQEIEEFHSALTILQDLLTLKKDKQILLMLGSCHRSMGNYQIAVTQYHQVCEWKKDKQTLLSLSFCYEEMGEDEKALSTCLSIPGWETDIPARLALSRYYQQKGNDQKALEMLEQIPVKKRNKTVLLSFARYHEEMRSYDQAISVFHQIRNWKEDKLALLGLARCYEAMGHYEKAMATFERMSNCKTDKLILLGMAYCYQAMRNYEKALAIFQQIPNWQRDKQILLALARGCQEIGDYEKATDWFRRIKDFKKDKQALLGLARCHQEMQDYSKAVATYQCIAEWKTDKQTLLSLARCYAEMKKENKALATYHRILNWETDRQTLLSLSRFYQEGGYYAEAFNLYKQIPDWKTDKQVLLSLACCCQEWEQDNKARYFYRQVTTQHPAYVEAYVHYGQYLIEQEDPTALATIEYALKKWSYWPPFSVLKAKYYEHQSRFKKALSELTEAKQQFLYHPLVYINLMKFYLKMRDPTSAQEIADECGWRFPGFLKLFKRIEQLQDNLFLFNRVESIDIDLTDNPKSFQLSLPKEIKKVFRALEKIPGERCLSGSTPTYLILNQLAHHQGQKEYTDLDFVGTCDEKSLLAHGFGQDKYIQNLYKKKIFGYSVDFYRVREEKHWKERNALTRDLTGWSILCDAKGNIEDITKKGITDIMQRKQREIGNPRIQFDRDPVRMLRVIRNSVEFKFEPYANIKTALQEWKPNPETRIDHLCAVARKHLVSFTNRNKKHYVQLLYHYGLLTKLFGIMYSTSMYKAVIDLEVLLRIPSHQNLSQYRSVLIYQGQRQTDSKKESASLPSLPLYSYL